MEKTIPMGKVGIPNTKTKQEEMRLVKAVSELEGKILGFNDVMGVYNYIVYESKGENNSPIIPVCVGVEKFELERNGIENYMRFSLISRNFRWLMGEILTIIEASIDDERKLKAVKDLIKDKFSAKISWIYEQCGCPEEEQDELLETPLDETR